MKLSKKYTFVLFIFTILAMSSTAFAAQFIKVKHNQIQKLDVVDGAFYHNAIDLNIPNLFGDGTETILQDIRHPYNITEVEEQKKKLMERILDARDEGKAIYFKLHGRVNNGMYPKKYANARLVTRMLTEDEYKREAAVTLLNRLVGMIEGGRLGIKTVTPFLTNDPVNTEIKDNPVKKMWKRGLHVTETEFDFVIELD